MHNLTTLTFVSTDMWKTKRSVESAVLDNNSIIDDESIVSVNLFAQFLSWLTWIANCFVCLWSTFYSFFNCIEASPLSFYVGLLTDKRNVGCVRYQASITTTHHCVWIDFEETTFLISYKRVIWAFLQWVFYAFSVFIVIEIDILSRKVSKIFSKSTS
jgi:hypothetical protein